VTARIAVALLAAALAGPANAGIVDASDYDAFWLWAGVAPQAVLERARTVYVLQGQVEPGRETVTAQGIAVPRPGDRDVWIVYRAHTLRWPPAAYDVVAAQLARWRHAGNRVVGVQIDFDARASHLPEYATFLRDLRGRLPADCRLGITGLLDWSTNADPESVAALAGVVDEVVVQTYQGRRTIGDYRRYLARLARLTLPFRIGVIQGGQWDAPASLSANPAFRGYVVFLQNRRAETAHEIPRSG
jgi:hypothetical protein